MNGAEQARFHPLYKGMQRALGHVSPATKARYAHLTDVTSAQVRERQGQLLASFVLRWREVPSSAWPK